MQQNGAINNVVIELLLVRENGLQFVGMFINRLCVAMETVGFFAIEH